MCIHWKKNLGCNDLYIQVCKTPKEPNICLTHIAIFTMYFVRQHNVFHSMHTHSNPNKATCYVTVMTSPDSNLIRRRLFNNGNIPYLQISRNLEAERHGLGVVRSQIEHVSTAGYIKTNHSGRYNIRFNYSKRSFMWHLTNSLRTKRIIVRKRKLMYCYSFICYTKD